MSIMFSEIKETPAALRALAKDICLMKEVAKKVKEQKINFVITVARGTSGHSTVYGANVFSVVNGILSGSAPMSFVTCYESNINFNNALVIGVSQSGEGPDVCQFLEHAKSKGATTVAFVNEIDSRLAKIVDFPICLSAGKEIAVAATKSYVASLACFYLLSMCIEDKSAEAVADLEECANLIEKVFTMEEEIKLIAERYRYMSSGVVLGRGYQFCNAYEAALKLAETCGIKMRGFSSAEFLHGPIASVHKDDPVFILAPTGKTFSQVTETVDRLCGRQAELIILSDDDELLKKATIPVKMPACKEILTPMVYICVMQIFANFLSLTIGNDPDSPEGLKKVTKTV